MKKNMTHLLVLIIFSLLFSFSLNIDIVWYAKLSKSLWSMRMALVMLQVFQFLLVIKIFIHILLLSSPSRISLLSYDSLSFWTSIAYLLCGAHSINQDWTTSGVSVLVIGSQTLNYYLPIHIHHQKIMLLCLFLVSCFSLILCQYSFLAIYSSRIMVLGSNWEWMIVVVLMWYFVDPKGRRRKINRRSNKEEGKAGINVPLA